MSRARASGRMRPGHGITLRDVHLAHARVSGRMRSGHGAPSRQRIPSLADPALRTRPHGLRYPE